MPVIHTVGFFPLESPNAHGEKLMRSLADATGGTFQLYDPLQVRVCRPDGTFMLYDTANEKHADTAERLWAEERLREMRLKNKSEGDARVLPGKLIPRIRSLHHDVRVAPVDANHKALVSRLRQEHDRVCREITGANDAAHSAALAVFESANRGAMARNQVKLDAAKAEYDKRRSAWLAAFKNELTAWIAHKEAIELQYDIVIPPETIGDTWLDIVALHAAQHPPHPVNEPLQPVPEVGDGRWAMSPYF